MTIGFRGSRRGRRSRGASAVLLLITVVFALLNASCSGLGQGNSTLSVPSIANLNPTSGVAGASVTITGANFGATQGSSTVQFNGTVATPTSWSATSIVVPVPTGATTGNVVVTVGGLASNSVNFMVGGASGPSITNLNPTSGLAGTSVTITGANFGATQGTSTVKFNGTVATPTNWSATSIVALVPAGATTGNVVVTVGGLASNGVNFTVSAVPAPSIASLNPTSGLAGASVTITGANFGATQGSNTVKFNGTAATPTNWSATGIAALVPPGATTGNVVVTVGGIASNGVSFTVLADTTPPVVTITTPLNNATVSGTIALIATATDPDSPVSFVQFLVDGTNTGTQLTAAPYSVSLDTTKLSNGSHALTAVAQDPSGNVGTSTAVTITVSNATNTTMGPLVPASTVQPGSNYFVVKGTTGPGIMLNGSHAWADYQDQGNNGATVALDFNAFVNFLKSHNQNATILQKNDLFQYCGFGSGGVWIVASDANNSPWQRITGSGLASDGLPKFDLTQFNQPYFDQLHARVMQLQQNNIYAILEIFDGRNITVQRCGTTPPTGDGYPGTGVNNINGVDDGYTGGSSGPNSMIGSVLAWQQAYMQKVVDTVNDLQNVLYEPCKEAPDDTWCRNMINAIHAYQNTKPNQHPVLYPALNGLPSDSSEINSNADVFAGSSHVIAGVNPCGSGTPTCKVNLNDSDHSYTMPGIKTDGALLNRNFVWENFTSGAGGVMFQDPYLMFWSASGRNLCDNGVPPAHGQCTVLDPYWEPLRSNLGYATILSQKLTLVKMSPSSLASTGWCLADDSPIGSEFVVYAPNGGNFTVDLSTQAGRTLNYQWLDPTSGNYSTISTVPGGNSAQPFTPPWNGSYDAVLYIVDAAGHN